MRASSKVYYAEYFPLHLLGCCTNYSHIAFLFKKGKHHKIFFSGDSGYDTHFKEIGDKYGTFDISLLECGQYNQDWKFLHMMPEETAKAGVDLKSKLILPVHWGAFTLAYHDWTDPIERILKKAEELEIRVTTPKIGETVIIGKDTFPVEKWWFNLL